MPPLSSPAAPVPTCPIAAPLSARASQWASTPLPRLSPIRAAPPSKPSAPAPRPAPIAAHAAPKSGGSSMHIVSPQPSKARIAPLAVLPVFFDLNGKRVIAIGGSEPATWKIELLAAAGAHVQVLAPIACWCDELIALAENGASAGTISLVDCRWAPSDLSGAALAVADIEDDAQAQAFVEAARDAGVPYNVIDRPEFCQF